MTGIELFHNEAKKRNFSIGETNVSSGDQNGDFIISDHSGKSTKQNYKKIADLYGNLTFFHFEPQEAINQIFEFIDHCINEIKYD